MPQRPGPCLVARELQLDRHLADLVLADGEGQAERRLAPLGDSHDLAQAVDEGHHGVVEAAIEEQATEGEFARAVSSARSGGSRGWFGRTTP
jgi:hypothetical protein